MMSAKEPVGSLPTINNDQFNRLVGGESSPTMFPVLYLTLDAQPERQDFVSHNFEELDKGVTKQGDGCLETKVRTLLLPQVVKWRVSAPNVYDRDG